MALSGTRTPTSASPGTGSRQLLEQLRATAEPRRARRGRGAPAPGHRALRRGPGPCPRARSATRLPSCFPGWSTTSCSGASSSCTTSTRSTSATRVESALESVRPFLQGHGGDVELLELDEERGAVHLRLLGSCDGCPSSAVTLRTAVEQAIEEAAPEILADRRRGAVRGPGVTTPVELGRRPLAVAVTVTETGPGDGAAADPLQVLARIRRHPAPGAPAPGRALRDVRDAHPRRARSRRRHRAAQPAVRLPRLLPALHSRPGRAASATAPFPTDTSPSRASSLSPGQWDELQIPVSVAFFFLNSTLERVAAFYPSPAGATESLLSLDAWDEVVAANPGLATLLPDVEALLVRSDRRRCRHHRVLPGAHRRLLRAGRTAPPAVARLRRRPARPTTRWRRSSPPSGPGPGPLTGRTVRDLAVLRGARGPGRAARRRADAGAAAAPHRGRRPSPSTPSPCAARS